MMSEHHWGWMIVVYLFLGGLGAGCLALSGVAYLTGRAYLLRVVRAGALAAPILVGAGSGLLIFDLGSPEKFWRLFVHINPVSPMSVGTWLLTLFTIMSTAYAILNLPPEWLTYAARHLPRLRRLLQTLAIWNQPGSPGGAAFPRSPAGVKKTRRVLAFLGVPLGLSVGIYTGVLLGAIPARPFWNTPMVAQLFLFSALSTATALLILITPLVWKKSDGNWAAEHRVLLQADLMFIFIELFIIIPFIIHSSLSTLSARVALEAVLGGPYTVAFWGGVVLLGILIPMVMEALDVIGAFKRAPRFLGKTVHYVVPVLILVGGYLVRWIFVLAGQESEFL
jgi:formate-dependent nitrite reductase membrane component NrfD